MRPYLLLIIALLFSTGNAHANLVVTSMYFGGEYAAEGTINDDGTFGEIHSIDLFFGSPWIATQVTDIITKTNGVIFAGPDFSVWYYDYSADIALMTDNQVAVGLDWDWLTATSHPYLAVFDCVTIPGQCVGQTTGESGVQFGGFQTGPFPGMIPTFSGTGTLSAVPAPAAVCLFGSGLLGLVGVARGRKV